MQLIMLTKNPCKKYLPVHLFAITQAQKINITSQYIHSVFSDINDRVPKAIISPKTDN
jgi:hypothetical protein